MKTKEIEIKEGCRKLIIDFEKKTVVQEFGKAKESERKSCNNPKYGDFVICRDLDSDIETIGIYNKAGSGLIAGIINECVEFDLHFGWAAYYAADAEKQILVDALHSVGKDWDAENKKVVEYWWRPNNGEAYYIPSITFECLFSQEKWCCDKADLLWTERHIVFKTKEEAIECAKKMLTL